MKGEHTITTLCETLGASTSGYYEWRRAEPSKRKLENKQLEAQIRQTHQDSRQTYGSVRVAHALGKPSSHNRIARIMRQCELKGRQRKRYVLRTTDSAHTQPIAPNRLAQAPEPKRRDEVWCVDITYIRTAEGWLYLAAVLDLWSRKIVGWAMGATLHTSLPLAALNMALRQRRPARIVMHHSDRGVQYASEQYRQRLDTGGLLASMSRKACCYDNASMESFWSTLKMELVYRTQFATHTQAKAAIFDYIECFYNRTRLHSALGYKSPLAYETTNN